MIRLTIKIINNTLFNNIAVLGSLIESLRIAKPKQKAI